MANITTAPKSSGSILTQASFAKPIPKTKHKSGLFGYLRIIEGIAIGIASIIAPESIPALLAIGAVDIGTNLGIDLVEQEQGIRTDIWGNLIVNTFANAIPFVSTIKSIGREAFEVSKISEALDSFKSLDLELADVGRKETLELLRQKKLSVDDFKSLSRREQQSLLKEARGLKTDLVSGLLEQAARTQNIQRLTNIAKPLDVLGVLGADGVTTEGKIQFAKGFLLKNDSLFEEIQNNVKNDVLRDIEEFGDNIEASNWKTLLSEDGIIGSDTLLNQKSLSKKKTRNFSKYAKGRASQLWDWVSWKETRNFAKNAKNMEGNTAQKIVKYFSGEAGYKATQRVQLLNANDFARETVNRPLAFLKKKVANRSVKYREFWEKKLGINKIARFQKAWEKNIIPFPDSAWLLGARVIKADPAGAINHLVVFHKNRKYRPVFIKGVPKNIVIEFMTATSKGAAYHKLFSWSKNGQDIIGLSWSSSALFSALPLNALRNILSTVSNLKGVVKTGIKEQDNFAKAYVQKYAETIARNAPSRVARTFGNFLFGGAGLISQQAGKFSSAAMKSLNIGGALSGHGKVHFNKNPFIKAALTTVRTTTIKNGRSKSNVAARMRRVSKRYLSRAKGIQSLTGLRSPRNRK